MTAWTNVGQDSDSWVPIADSGRGAFNALAFEETAFYVGEDIWSAVAQDSDIWTETTPS